MVRREPAEVKYKGYRGEHGELLENALEKRRGEGVKWLASPRNDGVKRDPEGCFGYKY